MLLSFRPPGRWLAWPLLLAAFVACGGDERGGGGVWLDGGVISPDGGAVSGASFLPLKLGAIWTYRVSEQSVVTMKTNTVEALEPAPMKSGVMAFRVVTYRGQNLKDKTVSWQEVKPGMVVRHTEDGYKGTGELDQREWWEPYKLRLDETAAHLKGGLSWKVEYLETHKPASGVATTQTRTETWTVESLNETLTVPYGTFHGVLKVSRVGTDSGAASNKTYWYARGIGKLKETGGQTEELVSVQGL